MSTIRLRIEKGFEAFAHWIYRHKYITLMVMAALIMVPVSQIPKITIDTSTEGFLHEKDPALLSYNAFRDQFGRDEAIVVALQPPAIFEPKFLETLKKLHQELEDNVPHLDDITSLINARNTRGDGDSLIVEELLENWPETPGQLALVRQHAMANPLYKHLLISEDGTVTTIIIRTQSHSSQGEASDILSGFETEEEIENETPEPTYLTDAENTQVVDAVNRIAARYRTSDLKIELAGSPVVTHFLKESIMGDMRKFMIMAIVAVCVLLYLMFHRITGVVLPLVIVILSLLCTLGIMAAFGFAIKVPTQILPSFILAVGVGTSVHILSVFFQRLRVSNDKDDAVAYALGHSGLAVVMTNVTTAAGLVSFSTADVAPIADLGIFAGIGVLLAFVLTITLLPALLAVIPLSTRKTAGIKEDGTIVDRFLQHVSRFSTTHPVKILAATALIVGIAIAGASQIRLSHHPLHWFPEGNTIREATEFIDARLNGSLTMEVVLDTGKENGLYAPELLKKMDRAGKFMEGMKGENFFVGKAWSVTTILKETHQALNEERPEFYAIPENKDLVAQELLLFENSGSDDLEDFVDSQFSKARLTIKVPFVDALLYTPALNKIRNYVTDNFKDTEFSLTGMMFLFATILHNTVTSMVKSYAIALVVITGLMMMLIGKVRIGLLSMIPNLTPIIITLGVIGWFSIPMDLFTMMVASIAIGLAVDDTIHFMHNFRRYYELTGDPRKAVFETLHTTGRAMLVTTVVLSLGFFIFGFATMQNIINFGLLTGFTILMALAADYLVAPALMVLVNRPRKAHTAHSTKASGPMEKTEPIHTR